MKKISQYLLSRLITGLLISAPVYLSVLLLLRVMESMSSLVKPLTVFISHSLQRETVAAFIIEEFEDGRYTVFVPSVPTPLAGSVYILEGVRVHPVDVPFTQAIKVVSR